VGGKIVARGPKSQLMKKIKKDKIKIDHKNNFLTYTGKEVGDNW
jgi:ribosomal protein L6P/L9E